MAIVWAKRVSLTLLAIVFLVLLAIIILIKTPWGNNQIRKQAVSWLSQKFNTELHIAELDIRALDKIYLSDVFMRDRNNDTLIALDSLHVSLSLSDLIAQKINLQQTDIAGLTVFLNRSANDSNFNFQFIPDAFSSTEPVDTTPEKSSSWQISLGDINLSKIRFVWDDRSTGDFYKVALRSLSLPMRKADLNTLTFDVKKAAIEGLDTEIRLEKSEASEKEESSTTNLKVAADELSLTNTRFLLEDTSAGMHVHTNAGNLVLQKVTYTLPASQATCGLFLLDDHTTTVAYRSINPSSKKRASNTAPSGAIAFSLSLDSISLERNNIALDDNAYPPLRGKTFDARHINLQDLALKASALSYNSAGYAANIRRLAFKDRNGFLLKDLQADARFSDTALALKDLVLQTPRNKVQGALSMRYASLEKMLTTPAETSLDLRIAPSVLNLGEFSYFSPALQSNASLKPLLSKDIQFDIAATGTLNRLNLSSYRIQNGNSIIKGSALIDYPLDMGKLNTQVNFGEITTTKSDLEKLLPKNLIPQDVWQYIPERATIKGKLGGNMSNLQPNIQIITSVGNATVKGYLKDINDAQKAKYDVAIGLSKLNVGKLIHDTLYGSVTGNAVAKGRGYKPETMQATLQTTLKEAGYNGYNYHDITLHGSVEKGTADAALQATDPNADMDAEVSFSFLNKLSNIKGTTDLRRIDLQALGFSDSVFVAKGKADLNFPVLDSARIEGTAFLENIVMQAGSRRFALDTIQLDASAKADSQFIALKSPVVDLNMSGRYSLQQIPAAMNTIMNNWLNTQSEKVAHQSPLYFELAGNVHMTDSLAPLIPGLKKLSPFIFATVVDTRKEQIVFFANINEVWYQDYKVDSVLIALIESETAKKFHNSEGAQFAIEFKKLQSPIFNLNKTSLTGNISDGVANTTLTIFDEKLKEKYRVPVTYVNDPIRPYISIPDSLLLNTHQWQVNAGNKVYLNVDMIQGSNLQLSKDNEHITVLADSTSPSGFPLSLGLQNFHLQSLTAMVLGPTQLIGGLCNGSFVLDNTSPLIFKTDISVDSFTLFGNPIANMHADVRADGKSDYLLDISLQQFGNDLTAKGSFSAETGAMDLQVHMNPFNLTSFSFILNEFVDSFSGGLKGDLIVKGTTKDPSINGNLSLDSCHLIVRQLNMPLHIPHAGLRFQEQLINFEGMTIADSAGRMANITGTGKAENLTNITYDLGLKADKFLVSGKKRYENQLISGPLFAGMALKIRGDLGDALIEGTVNIRDSSQITYVYRSDVNDVEGEGLIEFFDPLRRDSTDTIKISKKAASSSGFHYSVNTYVNLTPTTNVTIILDEVTGDQLDIKGKANLNYAQGADGTMQLVGSYEAEGGSYNMTIAGIIKKAFDIQKGSTITWSGDILKANANLTAVYKVKTDAEDLLKDVESTKGADKQKLNFDVYMMIKGEILKPAISFRLDMPVNEQAALNGTVYTRIKQINSIPSELNKQVMGLLALGSFIADNPFSSLSGGGGSIETEAFSTAGRLLTKELNNFLGSVVKNVDIDVGLDIRDDYTSGSAKRRSDLNVGFAKSFANNRLNVYVGNTLALENENQQADLLSGLASDVMVEYQLTSDGRYRLKGYRETEEDLTFNGMVVETGVTFVLVVEFNKFKYAFRKRNKNNK